MAGRNGHGDQSGAARRHPQRQVGGRARFGRDVLDRHLGEALDRSGIPELAIGLFRLAALGISGQQVSSSRTDQLLHHRAVHALTDEVLPLLAPVRLLQLAKPGAHSWRQLLDAGEPLLRQIIPDAAQRGVLQGIGWQPSAPFGEASQQAAVHQLEKPGSIHLQGPQPAEQLLTFIHLRRGEADALGTTHHIATGGRSRVPGRSPSQHKPADGCTGEGGQSQGQHHRPEASLRALLPCLGATAAQGCWIRGGDRVSRAAEGGQIRSRTARGPGRQHHGPIGSGDGSGAVRHRQGLERSQHLGRFGEATLWVLEQQSLKHGSEFRLQLELFRP